MNNMYNNAFVANPSAAMMPGMAFSMPKAEKMAQTKKPDSLFSMALFDMGSATQTTAHQPPHTASTTTSPPKYPSQLCAAEEYRDLSLRDILDLSEECLFSDDEDSLAGSPSTPLVTAPAPTPLTVVSNNSKPDETLSKDDLEWSQMEDPPMMMANSVEDLPVAAALVGSMENNSSHKKRGHQECAATLVTPPPPTALDQHQLGTFDEDDEEEGEHGKGRRFRPYQSGQWSEKFEELVAYRKEQGHCLVPHTYKENLPLARWVKRQRYQYKLMREGKASTMTEDRVKSLEDIGFIWDSQGAAWGERLSELKEYRSQFFHCNVPSNYSKNPQLATWVKCQRRQYKLHMEGKASNMTPQRIQELDNLGFEWELRSYKKQRTA